jgi:hypothetical protein
MLSAAKAPQEHQAWTQRVCLGVLKKDDTTRCVTLWGAGVAANAADDADFAKAAKHTNHARAARGTNVAIVLALPPRAM